MKNDFESGATATTSLKGWGRGACSQGPVASALRPRPHGRLSQWHPILPICLFIATLGGCCGYSTESLYRPDVQTVAIPTWTRGPGLYRRGLEDRLSEALAKRIQLDTPYKVIDKSDADTVLEGEIRVVGQRVMSFNPDTGEPRDIQIAIVTDFRWVDLRTGQIIVERKNFRATGLYYLSEPFNEDFYEGSTDAIGELAKRIVEQLETAP